MPHVCVGCYACIQGREEKCGGAAALAPLLAAMTQSELIVFCTPTYVYHTPGQMKTLLDHFAYRWMVHRPDLSFLKKQAVILNTAGGGGMRSTVREIKDSTDYWGIARTHALSQKVWDYDWQSLPASFRRTAERKLQRIVRRVRRHAAPINAPQGWIISTAFLPTFLSCTATAAAATTPPSSAAWPIWTRCR